MTQPIAYPLLSGTRHSFVSIEAKVAGLIFMIKSVNYSRTRTRTMVAGNHPDPVGKTRGKNEYKADCEMYLAEFNLLQAQLLKLGPYGDQTFTVLVTYSENGFDTIQDQILGCTLDSTESSNAEGPDPTVRKFELSPLKVLFNGADDTAPLVSRSFASAA